MGVGGGHWFVTISYDGGGGGQKGPKTALRNIWTTPKYFIVNFKTHFKNHFKIILRINCVNKGHILKFVSEHGKSKVKQAANKRVNEKYIICIFVSPGFFAGIASNFIFKMGVWWSG